MTISEIKQAVNDGKTVCWARNHYRVIKDSIGQFLIVCTLNNDCIGLTNQEGDKLNGREEDFFLSVLD